MKKSVLIVAVVLTALGCWGDSLQIGPGVGTDPVLLSSGTSFTVLNNPGNAGSDISTLLLFFSVPTNLVGTFSVAGSSPSLTFVNSFLMTSVGCDDVYECVGLPGLNDSNSFTNYTGAAAANGLPVPTSYTIFEYSDGAILHKQTLTFTGVSLPQGTFIVAAGAEAGGGEGFTAFTNAGLVTVPEPASLALFGSGLGVAALLGRRKLFRR